jgi:two-component system, chemotaxis family, sensor kinase CheA
MTTEAARLERLETIFSVELAERIQKLHDLVRQLGEARDGGGVGAIARELHSLKGAARAVEATAVEKFAHAAEDAALALVGVPDEAWRRAFGAGLDALPGLYRDPSADPSQLAAALVPVSRIPPPRGPETSAARDNPAPPQPPHTERTDQGSVRVSLAKLDTLLTESGELSVTQLRVGQRLGELRELQRQIERWQRDWSKTRPTRARLRRAGHRASREVDVLVRAADQAEQDVHAILQRTRELVAALSQNSAQLATVATAISQEVMAIRLLPAATIFMPLERLVRDLSRQMGKDVRLDMTGAETEVDRRILDELRDPLMHMVRNTIDHGIESPDERQRAGKSVQGILRLSATQRGDRVQIVVKDDGRGLDVEAIRTTAIRRSLVTAEHADQMDNGSLFDLIFYPGFSTREVVSEVSGRGVGMDVVRDHVHRLGGDVRVQTTRGVGTTFTITVPLTLATTRVLLIEHSGQTYAVPSSSIERTGRVRASELHRLEGRLGLKLDGRIVPVVELSNVLEQPPRKTASADEWRPFFVLPHGDRAVALLTDRLIDETELVVKALGAPLVRVRHVAGAAVLGTGALVVILNPADLFKSSLGSVESTSHVASAPASNPDTAAPRRRVLVVDDSVMTRTLARTILEAAGYSVVVASDGAHALELLNQAEVDAIVSDVEMPRMTGLELTAALRQDERWRHLPMVLVTSLDAPEHIERGAAVGADAYIVKGRFDQNDLLQTLGRLL